MLPKRNYLTIEDLDLERIFNASLFSPSRRFIKTGLIRKELSEIFLETNRSIRTVTIADIAQIFKSIGYKVAEFPEIQIAMERACYLHKHQGPTFKSHWEHTVSETCEELMCNKEINGYNFNWVGYNERGIIHTVVDPVRVAKRLTYSIQVNISPRALIDLSL